MITVRSWIVRLFRINNPRNNRKGFRSSEYYVQIILTDVGNVLNGARFFYISYHNLLDARGKLRGSLNSLGFIIWVNWIEDQPTLVQTLISYCANFSRCGIRPMHSTIMRSDHHMYRACVCARLWLVHKQQIVWTWTGANSHTHSK